MYFEFLLEMLSQPLNEGKNWQSALFLWGAPGTSKTVWAEILKKLVPSNFIQEFSRNQNQFTPNQLEHTRLLIVSDLVELTAKQVEVLKRILGRDTFTKEEKYQSEYGVISSFCQVLFISNFPPKSFPLFAKDQAILDKLIQVQLTSDLQIPAHLQIPNMSRLLDGVCSDIFNWAIHCNPNVLLHFIRAVSLNQLFENEEITEIPAFIPLNSF